MYTTTHTHNTLDKWNTILKAFTLRFTRYVSVCVCVVANDYFLQPSHQLTVISIKSIHISLSLIVAKLMLSEHALIFLRSIDSLWLERRLPIQQKAENLLQSHMPQSSIPFPKTVSFVYYFLRLVALLDGTQAWVSSCFFLLY